MKRSVLVWTSALCVLTASATWALNNGATIYVRARDTKVWKDADGGKAYSYALQPGDKLTWLEHPAGSKFHKVKTEKGDTGYVLFSAVSATAPKSEVIVGKGEGTTRTVDAQAFASYGAAARGLTEEAKKSAEHAPDPKAAQKAADALAKVESIAKSLDKSGGAK